MMNLRITIPGRAISANALYKRGRNGGVYLTEEAVAYRAMARVHVEKAIGNWVDYEGGPVKMTVKAYDNFYTKAGLIRDVDIDNSLKNLLDSIFPVLGVRDKVVFDLQAVKKHHPSNPPKCVVHIKEMA